MDDTENKENTVTDNRKENETHSDTVNETQKETKTDNETEKGKVTTSVNETDSGNINSTEAYLEHVKGKQGAGSYSSMLIEYRKTFLNIDMDIIEDLSDLFMLLW